MTESSRSITRPSEGAQAPKRVDAEAAMRTILNVTSDEYRDIQLIWLESHDLNGQFCEAEFQRRLWTRLACWLVGDYEVRVQEDKPEVQRRTERKPAP